MYAIIQLLLFLVILPIGLSAAAGDVLVFYAVEAGGFEISALFLLLHIYTSFRIVLLSREATKNICQICFYLFVYIWLVAVPPMQMYYNEWPQAVVLTKNTHVMILTLVVISILAFELGCWSARSRHHGPRSNSIVVPNRKTLYLAFLVYALIFTYFVVKIGDLSLLTGARVSPYDNIVGGSTGRLVADALFRVPPVVLSLVLFSLYLSGVHRRIRPFWPLATACAVMLLISNFPTANSRGRIGAIAIAFLVLWVIHRRSTLASWFPTILASGILVVFPLLGQTRRRVDWQELDWAGVRQAYFQGSFDAYQMLGIIVDYADSYGSEWGRQFLGAVFFWVPRSVWEDKPIGTGAQVATDLALPFTNLSAPLWAEAYISFGFLGVLVAFLILGRVSKYVSNAFIARSGMHMIFGSFFVGFQFFLLRGDLMTSFTILFPFIAVVFAVFWQARRVSLIGASEPGYRARLGHA